MQFISFFCYQIQLGRILSETTFDLFVLRSSMTPEYVTTVGTLFFAVTESSIVF